MQSSRNPLYANLYALIILSTNLSLYILTYSFIPTPYQRHITPHPAFSRSSCSCFIVLCLICPSVHCILLCYNILQPSEYLRFLPSHPTLFFFLLMIFSVHLSCAFTLETTRKPESRSRWMTGARSQYFAYTKSFLTIFLQGFTVRK